MGIEQEESTRRAPHMECYTEIIGPLDDDSYRLHLKIGNQGFEIGDGYENKESVEWMRDMLCIALDNLGKINAGYQL